MTTLCPTCGSSNLTTAGTCSTCVARGFAAACLGHSGTDEELLAGLDLVSREHQEASDAYYRAQWPENPRLTLTEALAALSTSQEECKRLRADAALLADDLAFVVRAFLDEFVDRTGLGPVAWTVAQLSHSPDEPYDAHIKRLVEMGTPEARRIKLADIADNLDPARLAALSAETRDRLIKKYERARAALSAKRG